MMDTLVARGRLIADRAVDAERIRLTARIGEEMPDLGVMAIDGGIELAGAGLTARLLDEPGLRWIGSLVR